MLPCGSVYFLDTLRIRLDVLLNSLLSVLGYIRCYVCYTEWINVANSDFHVLFIDKIPAKHVVHGLELPWLLCDMKDLLSMGNWEAQYYSVTFIMGFKCVWFLLLWYVIGGILGNGNRHIHVHGMHLLTFPVCFLVMFWSVELLHYGIVL